MAKPQKTEEQLKADIFNVYSKCREEQSSGRRQVYVLQLCDFIFRWCTSYNIVPKAEEMGLEIFNAVRRIAEKTLNEEKEFFSYLVTSLKNTKAEYYRKDISNINKLPREVKEIEKFISYKENNAGRILSREEKINIISKCFNKSEEKAKECLEMINNKNVISLTPNDDDEKEIDISDLNNDPESSFFSKINTPDFCKAVESVLQSKQERTRECYRALFTAYCINNSIEFEGAASVLNAEILEKYLKDGKRHDQYEVYKMYHPEVKKESAEVRASEMLKTFLNDLQAAMKEKN